jgi:hypothetical protein
VTARDARLTADLTAPWRLAVLAVIAVGLLGLATADSPTGLAPRQIG